MRTALLLVITLSVSIVMAQRADLFPLGIPRLADDEAVLELLEEQGYRPQEAFNRRDNPNGEQAYTGEAYDHLAQVVTKTDEQGTIDTVQLFVAAGLDAPMSRSKLRELEALLEEVEGDLTSQFGSPAYINTYSIELNGRTEETPAPTWKPGGDETGDRVTARIFAEGYVLVTYHRKTR